MANNMSNNEVKVTPWEVEGIVDYDKLIAEFGVKKLTNREYNLTKTITGELHPLMRRGVFYAHRDYDVFLKKYRDGFSTALYTGRGPSGYVHLGHILPWIFTKWLQDKLGIDLFFEFTDDEKFLYHKEYTLDYVRKLTIENILDLISLGFQPKNTHIIVDIDDIKYLYELAVRIAKKITFSTIKAVMGFNTSTNIGMIFYPTLQVAVCFLPTELYGRETHVLIPAAIDQDPYWRLARDIASSLGYPKPAQIHAKFLPGLGVGGKMSSSQPETAIFLTDSPEVARKKIMDAFTGGQPTAELQRKYGGNPDICPVYRYYEMMFEDDDDKLRERYVDCMNGNLLCGPCKSELAERIIKFLDRHQSIRESMGDKIEEYYLRNKF